MEPWLGICYLRNEDGTDDDFRVIAAVFCHDHESYDVTLKSLLSAQGKHLIWSEEVLPAGQWVARHPKEQSAAGLARTVHEHHLVEISTFKTAKTVGGKAPSCEYLTITEHEIPLLPDQSDIPFWDHEWIAPELKELLFGQPEENVKLRTYLIVDASLRKNITGTFDLDTLDVPVQCLFKGDAAEELKEVAPYLIDMTFPDGAWGDKDKVPSFHKNFFAKHWGQNTGIFIRTTALFADILGHFRKFPRIQVEEDKRWVYFRFWDPRIAPSYFNSIKTLPEKVSAWADMRRVARIHSFIGNQIDNHNAWIITPEWEQLKGFASIGNPVLSDAEMKGFVECKLEKFDRDTAKILSETYASMACDTAQFQEFTRIVRTWSYKYNITGERDILRLVHLGIALGAEFPKDARFSKMANILGDTKKPANARVRLCVSETMTWLAMVWEGQTTEGIKANLAQCIGYPIESYTDKTTFSRLTRQLHTQYVDKPDAAAVNGFVQGCVIVCDNNEIDGNYMKICYILCAFLYGQNFITDPQHSPLAECFLNSKTDTELQTALAILLGNFDEVAYAAG